MSDSLTPVNVDARFTAEGAIVPLAFTWNERTYTVAQQGRCWQDDDGRHHFLVMTPVDEVWELLFDPDELQWFIVRRHSPVRAV